MREVKFSYEQLLAPVRGAKHFFIKANVLFCVPKENQKSTRYFRGAGGTRKGLLAPFRPRRRGRNGKKLAAALRRVAVPSVHFVP